MAREGIKEARVDHSYLSPSGTVSKRTARDAEKRHRAKFSAWFRGEEEYVRLIEAGEIIDPSGKYVRKGEAVKNAEEAARLRDYAMNTLYRLAKSGMKPRRYTDEANKDLMRAAYLLGEMPPEKLPYPPRRKRS